MKIGLLECDHVRDDFHHIGGDYRDMFASLFPEWKFELYDLLNGHFPQKADACDLYVCTGSKHSVYEDLPWIHQLKSLVRDIHKAQKGFIGVCFGHQMMAEALGGKVFRAPQGWCIGVHTFEMIQQESWMKPYQPSINLLMLCQDQVQELPPDSTVLAKTPDCPVAMFRIGHHMLGIQAHPEFSAEYDQAIFESRVERIGQATIEAARKSMEMPLHNQLIASWIQQFAQLEEEGILSLNKGNGSITSPDFHIS